MRTIINNYEERPEVVIFNHHYCIDIKVGKKNPLNLNTMAGKTRSERAAIVRAKKKSFSTQLLQYSVSILSRIDKITLTYGSRHDPDNMAWTLKVFLDAMRDRKLIPDDRAEFVRHIEIIRDPEMDSEMVRFTIEARSYYEQ